MFNAIVIHKDEQGYSAELTAVDEQQLPTGDITVKVLTSTLNCLATCCTNIAD